MDEHIETTSRWLCKRDDADPDERVRLAPVGVLEPRWRHYEPAARVLLAGLLRQAAKGA